jgi:hypothetical protein
LWSQHNESRLLLGNLVDIVFGFADRLDARAVIFFSAAVLIASYVGLLLLVRRYHSARLTPIPVLVVGVVWFSLADVQNALWAFQLSWYLTTFFFVMMLGALLVPQSRRPLWLAGAVVLALAASLSTEGLICWPVGAIAILWPGWSRRGRTEIAIWSIATIVTLAAYLPGYRFQEGNICFVPGQCTTNFELHHPLTVLEFTFALIGNVIPGTAKGYPPTIGDPFRFVALGAVLSAASLFILIQSWRHRSSSEGLPLPALLIVFALLFDLTIVVGRSGTGVAGAVNSNRYLMANLILVTGVVIYGLARIPTHRRLAASGSWRTYGTYLALFVLAVFLVVQVVAATGFGLTNGRSSSADRIILNLIEPRTTIHESTEDHLGEYGPTVFHHYRELGAPPDILKIAGSGGKRCLLPPATSRSG